MPAKVYVTLSIQIPPEVREWLGQEAQRQGTTMTAVVLALIEQARNSARVTTKGEG